MTDCCASSRSELNPFVILFAAAPVRSLGFAASSVEWKVDVGFFANVDKSPSSTTTLNAAFCTGLEVWCQLLLGMCWIDDGIDTITKILRTD